MKKLFVLAVVCLALVSCKSSPTFPPPVEKVANVVIWQIGAPTVSTGLVTVSGKVKNIGDAEAYLTRIYITITGDYQSWAFTDPPDILSDKYSNFSVSFSDPTGTIGKQAGLAVTAQNVVWSKSATR